MGFWGLVVGLLGFFIWVYGFCPGVFLVCFGVVFFAVGFGAIGLVGYWVWLFGFVGIFVGFLVLFGGVFGFGVFGLLGRGC